MPIAVLLTDPTAPSLTTALVEDLARGWDAGPVRWLAPGEAAEMPLEAAPADLWARWDALQAQGLDLCLVPDATEAAPRRRRVLLADMDSTMIGQECIDELAEVAGVGAQVRQITARAMNGELDFEGALTERVALLRDLPEAVIDQVFAERITMAPGGAALVATMGAAGAHTVLVSGGFTAFTEKVAGRLGFHRHRANTLEVLDGRLTGEVGRPILGREAKVETLRSVVAERDLTPADVLAVGDGANDLGMLGVAGMGVAAHAKPAVAAACDLRVNFGDLTALLYLQGYTRDEIVPG